MKALKWAFGRLIVETDNNGRSFPENMIIVNNAILNDLGLFGETEVFGFEIKILSKKDC